MRVLQKTVTFNEGEENEMTVTKIHPSLFHPIRQLSENWNIEITTELLHYLANLTEHPEKYGVNFAEVKNQKKIMKKRQETNRDRRQ